MRVINPSVIAEAIFESDASLIYCVIDEDTGVAIAEGSISRTLFKIFCSSTNIAVDPPSLTLSEEASQLSGAEVAQQTCPPNSDGVAQPVSQASQAPVVGPSRRLTRRAASQTPAPEPAPAAPMAVDDDSQSAPKRVGQPVYHIFQRSLIFLFASEHS